MPLHSRLVTLGTSKKKSLRSPAAFQVLGLFAVSTLVALHTEESMRSSGVFEILDLLFAILALETCLAKGPIPREDGQILYLVVTDAAAVCTIVADE